MKQGHLRGTRGTPTPPRRKRRRRYVPARQAAPRVPQDRLFDPDEAAYLAYKARRKELGL